MTSRTLKPVLIDARTAEVTNSRDMPWYVTTLLISQPPHFGDYGGTRIRERRAFQTAGEGVGAAR